MTEYFPTGISLPNTAKVLLGPIRFKAGAGKQGSLHFTCQSSTENTVIPARESSICEPL